MVAATLGRGAVLAYLVCAVLFGLVGLCFAEAGSRIGSAGGLYAYASVPFGPVVGGEPGTLLWLAAGASADAAIANLLADTLGAVTTALGGPWVRLVMILALFAAVAWVNVRGVKYGVRLSVAMTIVKTAPLVLLVLAGVFFIDPARLAWTEMPSLGRVGQASVILFFAFIGVEAALSMSGEVVRPSRTVPRGILMGLVIVSGLYVGLQLVAQGTLGDALKGFQGPAGRDRPDRVRTLGQRVPGRVSVAGCQWLRHRRRAVVTARLFVFAHRGQLPRQLGSVHPRFGTPHVAIITYAIVCAGLALSGSFRQMAVISSSGTLILYAICCLGVLRLRARNVATEGEPFVVPGGPIVPIFATVIIIWMLSSLSRQELYTGLAVVAVLTVAFALLARRNRHLLPQLPTVFSSGSSGS